MRRHAAALSLAALAVAASVSASCTRAVAPAASSEKPTIEIGVDVPIKPSSARDKELLRLVSHPPDNGVETTMLPSIDAARNAFVDALVPQDTLGRHLIGIRYQKAREANRQPSEALDLYYEGGLVVVQAKYPLGYIGHMEDRRMFESTKVASFAADAWTYPRRSREAMQTGVRWADEDIRYSVVSSDLTRSEVVQIARSMIPS